MDLYTAGLISANVTKGGRMYATLTPREKQMRDENDLMLESYHYVKKQAMADKVRADGTRIFLDSGAFSAFTLGEVIDIGEYCAYIERNADFIKMASVLDAIGDHKGTYKNQMEMQRRLPEHLWPLPCAHYGEPDEVVKWYVDNYDYITIGGLVPISTPQMILWLDHIFERILCDEEGRLKTKVHLFGVTSLPLMLRYNATSVDSSTWIQWGKNGLLLLPGSGRQVNISDKSSSRKDFGKHYDNVSEEDRAAIDRELAADGIETERVRSFYPPRWVYNSWAFPEYLRRRRHEKSAVFVRPTPGLF